MWIFCTVSPWVSPRGLSSILKFEWKFQILKIWKVKNVVFSGKTHNAQIDILSDLSGNKTIALRLRSLLIVPLNSWGDIWSLRAWMYYLYIHSLIGSIAHTDLIQRNWAMISTQARDYLPLLLLYNAKLPLNLAIKSPRYAFSQRELQLESN